MKIKHLLQVSLKMFLSDGFYFKISIGFDIQVLPQHSDELVKLQREIKLLVLTWLFTSKSYSVVHLLNQLLLNCLQLWLPSAMSRQKWRLVTYLPFTGGSKDRKDPNTYRAITLSSAIFKKFWKCFELSYESYYTFVNPLVPRGLSKGHRLYEVIFRSKWVHTICQRT